MNTIIYKNEYGLVQSVPAPTQQILKAIRGGWCGYGMIHIIYLSSVIIYYRWVIIDLQMERIHLITYHVSQGRIKHEQAIISNQNLNIEPCG